MQASHEWAQLNFGNCQLGDKRRTQRLVHVAADVANNPSASLPDQMASWGDLKAAYNLFDCQEVTFAAIARPHWEQTKQRTAGRFLVIGDTPELDFGKHREVENLGPTGNGSGRGFLLHNGLLVNAENQAIVGLASQTIHYRTQKTSSSPKKKESCTARLKRPRESQVWGQLIDDIGPPPSNTEFIHVLDRGGDNFEVYCHLLEQRCGWVVRAGRLNRNVLVGPDAKSRKLSQYLPQLESAGSYELSLRARPHQAARTAKLEVRVGSIQMPVPRHSSPWVRQLQPQPIRMNVVYVIEVDAPAGVEPIRWVLLTSLPVATLADTWRVIEYYESRWLVEEYHKALKTAVVCNRVN